MLIIERHLRATRARARQCRTSGLAQWRTNDTLRIRLACESSIVHAKVRSKQIERTVGTFAFDICRERPMPRERVWTNSAHDTLRRPYERSDIAGIIVQIQTVSQIRERIPDVRLRVKLSSWSAKLVRIFRDCAIHVFSLGIE